MSGLMPGALPATPLLLLTGLRAARGLLGSCSCRGPAGRMGLRRTQGLLPPEGLPAWPWALGLFRFRGLLGGRALVGAMGLFMGLRGGVGALWTGGRGGSPPLWAWVGALWVGSMSSSGSVHAGSLHDDMHSMAAAGKGDCR